jgi:hypothetical protein
MIPYIINVALILAGCLVFYKLLLGKETFYRLNRYMLMLCLLIAFSLPFLPVPQQFSLRKTESTTVRVQFVPQTTVIKEDETEGKHANNSSSPQQNPESATKLFRGSKRCNGQPGCIGLASAYSP